MEGAGSANDDVDDLDIRVEGAVCLKCSSDKFVDFVNVFNDCLYVAICRVFASYDLDLSSSAVC